MLGIAPGRPYPAADRPPGTAPWERNAMRLTDAQIRQFNEEGWLFLPETFSAEEVAVLRAEADGIYAANRPEIWREKSGAPRTAFAAHTYNEAFRLLGAHPRLVEPIEQIFGEKLYMHQFKINAKAAFTGDVWQWHQDYGTWLRDDGMPEPRAMNIAVFLDEVMPINGPLMLIPRSQHHGNLKAGHDLSTTSYPLWTLDDDVVTELVAEGGIVAPTGKPGGVLMFHGNLVHGSAPNITPYPRKIVYLTLNAVSNHIRKPTRAEWIAHTDFTPIEPVPEDALLQYARAWKQAAE
jgi:ectoine hydroxylase